MHSPSFIPRRCPYTPGTRIYRVYKELRINLRSCTSILLIMYLSPYIAIAWDSCKRRYRHITVLEAAFHIHNVNKNTYTACARSKVHELLQMASVQIWLSGSRRRLHDAYAYATTCVVLMQASSATNGMLRNVQASMVCTQLESHTYGRKSFIALVSATDSASTLRCSYSDELGW